MRPSSVSHLVHSASRAAVRNHISVSTTPGGRLKQLLNESLYNPALPPVQFPGVTSPIFAQLATRKHHFPGLYVSGGATSVNSAALPDIGLLSCADFTDAISRITSVCDPCTVPVLADADTGAQLVADSVHPLQQMRIINATVWRYQRARAAGFHIEDQVFPKRCGHLEGKQLQPVEDFVETIKSARDAVTDERHSMDPDFVICARTDARSVMGLEEVIRRGKLYCDAGADMIFPEGLLTADEFKQVAEGIHADFPEVHLLANMTEFGQSPLMPADELRSFGYTAIIYPVSTLRSALGAADRCLAEIKTAGKINEAGQVHEDMMPRKEMYDLMSYEPARQGEWEYPDGVPGVGYPPISRVEAYKKK
eukprot:Nk52_evm6s165 gene=Nk52_evmTU6s165